MECDEEIDSETEASLYAQIYHAPLDLNRAPTNEDLQSVYECQVNTVAEKPLDVICDFQKPCKQCPPVVYLSSDNDSHDSSSSLSPDSSSRSSWYNDSSANVNLHIIPSKSVKYADAGHYDLHENKASTSFDNAYMLENFSVDQIQERLPSNPECWKISDEDLYPLSHRQMSGRYYRRVHCKRCNEMGHRAADCPTPNVRKVCFVCGDKKHPGTRCQSRSCTICFSFGHFTQQCSYSLRKIENMYCVRCDSLGHLSDNCSDSWRQFHSTTKTKKLIKGDQRSEKRSYTTNEAIKYCFNCGRRGHLGSDCQRLTAYGNRLKLFSSMVHRYKKDKLSSLQCNDNDTQEEESTNIYENRSRRYTFKKQKNKTLRKTIKQQTIIEEDAALFTTYNKIGNKSFSVVGRENFDQLMKNRNNNRKQRRKIKKEIKKEYRKLNRLSSLTSKEPKKVKLSKNKMMSKKSKMSVENSAGEIFPVEDGGGGGVVNSKARNRNRNRKKNRKNLNNPQLSRDDIAVDNIFQGLHGKGFVREASDANNNGVNGYRSKFRNTDFTRFDNANVYSWDVSADHVTPANSWFS